MTKEDIQTVLERAPELGEFGFDNSNWIRGKDGERLTPEQRKENLELSRQALLRSVESFEKACEWLAVRAKRKTINRFQSSYGLKHRVEEEVQCYIANGVFIAAAMHCGFQIERVYNSPNCYLNISQKAIRRR